MTTLYISSLVVVILAFGAAFFIVHKVYSGIIATLQADNLDLRSRLFISKGQPPVGVNVTEQYQEKQVEQKEQRDKPPRRQTKGPLESVVSKWTKDDRKLAEKSN